MTYAQYFSPNYAAARDRFIRAAKSSGARIASYENPNAVGPYKEKLTLDCAWIGPEDADTVVLSMSGTHGAEGYCGSAAQTAWLDIHSNEKLPDGVAVLFVHAVNPFGFAHCLRVNENFVDLNRSAIDFEQPLPKNPLFAEIHESIRKAELSENPAQDIARTVRAFSEEKGHWAVSDALQRGQFEFQDGAHFGGFEKQWSVSTVESAVEEFCAAAKHIVYIDWHSLIDVSDDAFVYLCFNQTGDHLFNRVASWWGHKNIARETVNEQWAREGREPEKRPSRHGLLMWGLQHAVADHADLAGAVIEFCCNPRPYYSDPLNEIQIELDARHLFALSAKQGVQADELRAAQQNYWCPVRSDWQEVVIPNALKVYQLALGGAEKWHQANIPADPGKLVRYSQFD